jgi:hypothetical protein
MTKLSPSLYSLEVKIYLICSYYNYNISSCQLYIPVVSTSTHVPPQYTYNGFVSHTPNKEILSGSLTHTVPVHLFRTAPKAGGNEGEIEGEILFDIDGEIDGLTETGGSEGEKLFETEGLEDVLGDTDCEIDFEKEGEKLALILGD